jgi:hypothetical protein
MVHEDLYGLRLSATAQAAQAYNAGLRRILLVQAGPSTTCARPSEPILGSPWRMLGWPCV